MAVPTTYVIYRDSQPDQPFDPTAPLIFYPPKDSDELFDILRAKYPHLKSHSERVREAVIEYLLQEPRMDQTPLQPLPTPRATNSATTSPWQTSFPSMCSETSTWSSPDTAGLVTPTYPLSPQTPALSRQFSAATSVTGPSESSPPALENMTGVFSLCDSSQPKQRIRRKMTEAEKVEYRKRRIVKACEKCAKRKRKCNHNEQDMEGAATKSHKVSKSNAAPTAKKPPAPNLPKIQELDGNSLENTMDINDPFVSFMAESFGDLNSLDLPLPEMDIDNFLASSQPQWPWSDTPDWTLMDQGDVDTHHKSQLEHENDLALFDDFCLAPAHNSGQLQTFENSQQGGNGMGVLWEHLRTGQEQQEIPPRMSGTHFTEGDRTCTLMNDRDWMLYGRGDDWEDDWAETYVRGSNERGNNKQKANLLVQLTLRLVGTTKAVAAFGRLLNQHSSQSRFGSITIGRVAEIVQTSLQGDIAAKNATRNGLFIGGRPPLSSDYCDGESRSSTQTRSGTDQSRSSSSSHTFDKSGSTSHRQQLQRQLQEDSMESELIIRTQQLQTGKHQELASQRSGALQISGMEVNSRLEPCRQPQWQPAEARTGKQATLGEGITSRASPSTELFMLKRRIPRALHSIVDRDNRVSESSTLRQLQDISGVETQTTRDYEREITAPRSTEGNITRLNRRAYWRLDSAFPHSLDHTSSTADNQVRTPAGDEVSNQGYRPGAKAVEMDRLSDHVRRRDHFGRPDAEERHLQILYTLASLGFLLAFLSLLPRDVTNLSLLLLALASPVRGAQGTHKPRSSQWVSEVWGTVLQWAAGGSEWASQFERRRSDHGAEWKDAPRILCSRDVWWGLDGGERTDDAEGSG